MGLFQDMLHSTKSVNFSQIYYFFIIVKMSSRAGQNAFTGRIWPIGRSLETLGYLNSCIQSSTQTVLTELPL